MKRFVFRLQAALDHRKRLEEQRRAELAAVQQRLRDETDRLNRLISRRNEAMRRAAAERVGRVSPDSAEARVRFLDRLQADIAEQQTAVQLVQREIERKVQEVVAATQQTQAMENLRVRHLQEYRAEQLREEQKFLDEIASIRAARAAGKV